MVGVPRLSQGCTRCRRLKKGCDRSKPTCSQCERLGVACEYKERQWTFVPAAECRKFQTVPSSAEKHETLVDADVASIETQSILLDGTLACTARALGVVEEFWSLYEPRDLDNTILIDGRKSVPWVNHVQNHAMPEALEACAFMLLGGAKKIKSCHDIARRFYVSSLRKVNACLQDPDTMDVKTVMSTCKVLSLYEHQRKSEGKSPGTQAVDWRQHISGICRIVQVRGADELFFSDGEALFENIHLNAITVNYILRKRELRLKDRYTLPPHHVRTYLLMILDEIPESLDRHDKLLAQSISGLRKGNADLRSKIARHASDLISTLRDQLRRLHDWEQSTLVDCYTKGGIPVHSTASLDDCCTNFGMGFIYTVCLYWTGCLVVSSTIRTTMLMLEKLLVLEPQRPPLPLWMESRPYATKIALHAKDFYTSNAGLWGAEVASFPIGIMRRYCYAYGLENSTEMTMLKDAINSQATGEGTTSFIRSVLSSVPNDVTESEQEELLRQEAKKWYGVIL